MSILPSKKKVQLAQSSVGCLQSTLSNILLDPTNPYSLLVETVRKVSNVNGNCNGSKSKKRRTMTKIELTPIAKLKIRDAYSSGTPSQKKEFEELRVKHIRAEAQRKQIQKKMQMILSINKKRLQITNSKLSFLQVLNENVQIEKLIKKYQQGIKDSKSATIQISLQHERMQREITRVTQILFSIENKIQKAEKQNQHLQQKQQSIEYALISQSRKNKNLVSKFSQAWLGFWDQISILKLAKDLFSTLILKNQIQNAKDLKKIRKGNNRSEAIQILHEEFMPICFIKDESFQKLPQLLTLICHIYIRLKCRTINKSQLDRTSFFCSEAKRIFGLEQFIEIVSSFYKMWTQSNCFTCSQQNQQIRESQIKKKSIEKERGHFGGTDKKLAQIQIDEQCRCGQILLPESNRQFFTFVLEKYLNITVRSFCVRKGYHSSIFFPKQMIQEYPEDELQNFKRLTRYSQDHPEFDSQQEQIEKDE